MDLMNLITKMSESNFCYVIERVVNKRRFYLYDIDEGDNVGLVKWTPNMKQALAFAIEEEVEEIKSDYRSLNTSVIVRVGKNELGNV